jgi:hypothetical protein
MTGYNLVRGPAVEGFRDAFTHRFNLPEPETLSAIKFLRQVQRRQPFLNKVIGVNGFPDLWRVCPDGEGLGRMLFRLFFRRMNWLQNQNLYVYFVLPDRVTFSAGEHLCLRISADLYADMTDVFGQLKQVTSNHYHHNFTVSQV